MLVTPMDVPPSILEAVKSAALGDRTINSDVVAERVSNQIASLPDYERAAAVILQLFVAEQIKDARRADEAARIRERACRKPSLNRVIRGSTERSQQRAEDSFQKTIDHFRKRDAQS